MHFILEEALTKRWPFIAEDSLFVSTSLVLDSDHTSSKKKVELWWQGRNSTITSKSIGRFCKFCSYELPWCKNLFKLAQIVVVHLTRFCHYCWRKTIEYTPCENLSEVRKKTLQNTCCCHIILLTLNKSLQTG